MLPLADMVKYKNEVSIRTGRVDRHVNKCTLSEDIDLSHDTS